MGRARPSRVKPRQPDPDPGPQTPFVPPKIDPSRVFVPRDQRKVHCEHCGSTRVTRNGGSPYPVAHYKCLDCTDDEGNLSTFKIPAAR